MGNLDPQTPRGLQCSISAASRNLLTENTPTVEVGKLNNAQLNHLHGLSKEQPIARKTLVQDSIILSKRYANATKNLLEHQSLTQDYVLDYRTTCRPPRVLTKSRSVDTAQPKTTAIPIHTLNCFNINTKSNPNVSNAEVVGKTKLFKYFLKKTIGEKTLGTINKFRQKTDLVYNNENRNSLNKFQFKNSVIKQDEVRDINCLSYTYHEVDNSPYTVQNSQFSKLKHRDVSKQTYSCNTDTKELPKEFAKPCDKSRIKTKYSPPPESESRSIVSSAPANKIKETLASSDKKSETATNSDNKFEVSNMLRGGLKLKERLMVGLSIFAVLFTLFLVIDIQMDLGISGKHFVPSHGKVKYVVQEEGPGSAYNRFRNRLLQKTHRLVF